MTHRNEDQETEERRLERLVSGALAEAGELIPTTSAEVERAEAEGVELHGPLPPGLRELRPAPARPSEARRARGSSAREPVGADNVVFLDRTRRRGFASHALAAMAGAAAAAALLLLVPRLKSNRGAAGALSAEPGPNLVDAGSPVRKVTLPADTCPSACCGGSACSSAKEGKSCSSGRTCIACSLDALGETRYRVRLGAFTPTSVGRAALDEAPAGFDLCVRVGGSELVCVPASTMDAPAEHWTTLTLLPSAEDLAAGFELSVRPRGATVALAKLRDRIQVNPALLCKGMLLRPLPIEAALSGMADAGASDGGAEGALAPIPLGVVSLFLDDPYWVEIGRGDSVAALRAVRDRYDLDPGRALVFDTSERETGRFALVLGPYDKRSADNIRWRVLEQGEPARVVVGRDHVGPPLPLE